MMPASEGDCFIVRYGDIAAPRQILIDTGRKATYKKLLSYLPENRRHFELLVISHVDRDHIEGALSLLTDKPTGFTFDDIWFNAYRHLEWKPGWESFGALQGEKVTNAILSGGFNWNAAFEGGPVRIETEPRLVTLPGGMELLLLSPDAAKLKALEPDWEKECRRAGLDPETLARRRRDEGGDFEILGGKLEDLADAVTKEDGATPNGSSIAFIARYEGCSVLFAADAHSDRLCESLSALTPSPHPITLFKLPHHGSKANNTTALIDAVDCSHFLVSTNGSYFDHPDQAAIARVVVKKSVAPKTLYFNYDQEHTRSWNESHSNKRKYGFVCRYPDAKDIPTVIDVEGLT